MAADTVHSGFGAQAIPMMCKIRPVEREAASSLEALAGPVCSRGCEISNVKVRPLLSGAEGIFRGSVVWSMLGNSLPSKEHIASI